MTKVKNRDPKIRLLLGDAASLGPGKIELINAIEKSGSIAGAAKMMGMSYRRAWNLIDKINSDFDADIVVTSSGGKGGGGAVVTEDGRDIIDRYHEIEAKALECVKEDLNAFGEFLVQKSRTKKD